MRTTTVESKKTSRGRAGPDALALLKAEVDLRALGDEMATRQQELKAEMGMDDEAGEEGEEEDNEDAESPAKSANKKAGAGSGSKHPAH